MVQHPPTPETHSRQRRACRRVGCDGTRRRQSPTRARLAAFAIASLLAAEIESRALAADAPSSPTAAPVTAAAPSVTPPAATRPSDATNDAGADSGESIFLELAVDPYLRRYGRKPGQGWIPVPLTRTEVRLGGFMQLNVIHDFQSAGVPYGSFVPSTIPVPTEATPNTEFDPRTSRLTLETRTNTEEVGSVDTMLDLDWYGNPTAALIAPRLRQAYVTWVGPRSRMAFTVGQAWSTFLDLDVWPELLDLQGPNSMTGQRQGLVRGSLVLVGPKTLVLDVGIEQPGPGIQGGTAVKELPDFTARLTWQEDWGHLTGAAVARQLVAQDPQGDGRDHAFGCGVSLSGSWNVLGTERQSAPEDDPATRQDRIQFEVQAGSGNGRYVFDLASAPTPQDAVYDPRSQALLPLAQIGGFLAYHRWWTDRLRSQLVFGLERVLNRTAQAPNEFERSTYLLLNLGYRVFRRMDVGIEGSRGDRRDKDGRDGYAYRVLLGANYGF